MNTTSHTFKFRYTILRHNKYPKVYRPKVNTLLKAISTKKRPLPRPPVFFCLNTSNPMPPLKNNKPENREQKGYQQGNQKAVRIILQ